MIRAAVRAASESNGGDQEVVLACEPRRADATGRRVQASGRPEGPADLRLVPPALAAWAATGVALGDSGEWTVLALTLCAVAAVGVLGAEALRARRLRRSPRSGRGRGRSDTARPSGAMGPGRSGLMRPGPAGVMRSGRVAVAMTLLCTAAALGSTALHTADLYRGPVPALAREYARATAELEVTADPRPIRARAAGARILPPGTAVEADVVEVTTSAGQVTETRTPVLLLAREADAGRAGKGERRADAGRAGKGERRADAGREGRGEYQVDAEGVERGERESSPWRALLPSTRLRVDARLAPPMRDGDRIAAVIRVPGGQAPRVVQGPSALQRTAGKLRAGLRAATEGLTPDARALLPGLVVGDTGRVTEELDEAFRATDLTHLLAVSGSNLTIVLILLTGPPGRAMRAERGGLAPRLGISLRGTALLGGALTLAFVVVCRPDPSVLRAAACGLIVLVAVGTGRRRSLIPALAAAVLLLVLYDPWLARSYGFALSVLATGALLTLAPGWSAALRRRRVPGRVADALAAALAAQAVCAPVVAVLAARVSLVAVPCNLLAELAVAPATVLGFAALALAPVSLPLAKGLCWVASWPVEWIAEVARRGAALPGAGVDWPGGWRGGALLAGATVCGVVLVGRLARGSGRRVLGHPATVGVCALLFLFAVVRPAPLTRVISGWPPPGWRLVMCDVGQGDATVLATGPGEAVLVDAGPDPALVDRCLSALGVTRIPLVLLTHFHADHVTGLPGALRGREVGLIQTTPLEVPQERAEFVKAEAAARDVPVVRAVAGERRRAGPLRWRVVWPPVGPGPHPQPEGPNDASVTLLAEVAGLKLLLPGDLEPPAQQALLRALPRLPTVDVLKVAHHGSAYQDPELMRRLDPRLALISAGRDNEYGHPAPGTLAALRSRGALVLRTDVHGSVAVTGTGPDLHATPSKEDNGPGG
ncbi:ComEC/Rec2 family competence protein [Streptomyces luteolus]|uniref:ComEC/Rec2 family competence protein n=1 Tax=Streptomyces luteolus TaxID=3043615 RepID=A0ABT6T097_9ACTN|nr:ComEC/Rec2 family competence protein [Streptomyces sp. B-S-A12]MDI3421040.1 ComEC/Rec2 family competence protein [Streptomyces sp. B-S-A12]